MFQPSGFNGSIESGFGQRACVCSIWPQLKHLILEKSHPCRKGGRCPCPKVNGVRGDPGGWFARQAIGHISYPILLARASATTMAGSPVLKCPVRSTASDPSWRTSPRTRHPPQSQRPARLAYECSRTDRGWRNPCKPQSVSVVSGPSGFE